MYARLFALLILCCSTCFAQEIPLSDIWALNMPGTKDVYGLGFAEPDRRRDAGWGPTEFREMRENAINQMIISLSGKLPSEEAPRAFIFPWQPNSHMLKRIADNLRKAKGYEILELDIKEYQKGSDMTLVYFSYPSSYYNHIKEVKREDHTITVSYQVVPHYTAESTVHFALIPLKGLPAGEFKVKFEQLQMDKDFYEAGFIQHSHNQQKRYVCNDFSFRVWEPVEPDRTEASKNAKEIPLDTIWGFDMPGTRDMRELNPTNEYDLQSVLHKIRKVMFSWFRMGEKADKGFAVSGTGEEVLLKIEQLVTKKKQTSTTFTPTDSINLFIFRGRRGSNIRLDRIMLDGRQIRVEYHFGSRDDVGIPLSVALIPLGKLDEGRYNVEMIMKPPQLGPKNPFQSVSQSDLEQFICQSFSFSVQ